MESTKLIKLNETLSERIDRRVSLFSFENKDCDDVTKKLLSDAITRKPLISGNAMTYTGNFWHDLGKHSQAEVEYRLSVNFGSPDDGTVISKVTDVITIGNKLHLELIISDKDNSFEAVSNLLDIVVRELFKINTFRYVPFTKDEIEKAEEVMSECSNINGGQKSFRYKMASAIKHFKLLEDSLNGGFSWDTLWNAYDEEFGIKIPSDFRPVLKESISKVGQRFIEVFMKTKEASYLAELLPFINFRKKNPNKREERALREYGTDLSFDEMSFKFFSNANFFLKEIENIISEAISEYQEKVISKQHYSLISWRPHFVNPFTDQIFPPIKSV